MTPGSIFEDGAPKGASAYDVWKHRYAQETAAPRHIVAYPVDQDGLPGYVCLMDPATKPWTTRGLSATLRAFNRR